MIGKTGGNAVESGRRKKVEIYAVNYVNIVYNLKPAIDFKFLIERVKTLEFT